MLLLLLAIGSGGGGAVGGGEEQERAGGAWRGWAWRACALTLAARPHALAAAISARHHIPRGGAPCSVPAAEVEWRQGGEWMIRREK